MQIYADSEFVQSLSHLNPEEKEAVERCLYKIKNGNWDIGLRVKRLKGFPKRVWEARVNRADRLLFLIASATHESSGETGSIYVLDYVSHDRVTRVRRRDLSASSPLSFLVEQVQQSENISEDFEDLTGGQLNDWIHEEASSGGVTEYIRAYAQSFVASAEEIKSLPSAEREIWLTEEQMGVVTTMGHCLVSGTAGSGKTTMALQRLLADAGSDQPKLYLAYNPWLVDYARELFQRLLPQEHKEAFRDVIHFKTMQQLTREHLGPALESFPEEGEVRFVDFQLPYQAWNKQIPSATAWSEIRSIIKGACLDPKRDLLDLKEYRELGRSRSAYLHQDREVIHKLAQQYQKWLKEKKRYDEIDLSRQAIRQIINQRPAGYGTIVCDEVQDLTEIQLELVFLLNRKDGSLFFTGDLNQIINPSGFRWEEVNNHFYRRKQQKPQRQHLSYNFRSVGSIVKLADGLLNLRGRLIGGSAEQQEHYLQEGQKPRLINNGSEEAIKSIVRLLVGQYAVLVRTEAQRNRLKVETGSPFIFTIEEAKGLEFDRVLVWDFFRDQHSLWRKALGGTLSAKDGPSLRHELSLLYVAATRPRRLLYFYDPQTTIWAESELDGTFDYAVPESLAEGGEERLTPEQWSQQGNYYLDRDFFEQAAFCFEQAEDLVNVRRVRAKLLEHKQKWEEAGEEYFALQDFPAAARLFEKGGAWQRASEAHQQTGASQEALRCDAQAAEAEKQWVVASYIWSSLGQAVKALEALRKTNDQSLIKPLEAEAFTVEGKHDLAAILYEQVADWDKAIQSWEKAEHWQAAADVYLKAKRYAEANAYAEKFDSSLDRISFRVKTQIAQNNFEEARRVANDELPPSEAIKLFQQAGLNAETHYFEARLAEERGQLALALHLWKQIGEEEEVKRIELLVLEQHPLPLGLNQRLSIGSPRLFQAASHNNVKSVKHLLAQGADVNGQTISGKTALMAATSFGNTEVMQSLLNVGADTEVKDNDGWTALMYAATEGDVRAVELLLDYGADINGRNGDGSTRWANDTTPLMGAAYWGEETIVEFLLERGADKVLLDKSGKTASKLAKEQDHKAIVLLLENYRIVEATTRGYDAKAKAEICRKQGDAAVNRGQWEVAISQYSKALNLNPDLPGAGINLGGALGELGRWQEALVHLQDVLSKSPNNVIALVNTGNALAKTGSFDEAIMHYEKALAIAPDNALARNNLSAALELKQLTNPPVQDTLESSLYRHLAEVADNPKDAVALFNLGYCLSELGRPADAMEAYSKARFEGLSHSALHYNIGECLLKLGQPEQAIYEFRKAVVLQPDNNECHNALGAALAGIGHSGEALSEYKKAISIKPEDFEALTNIGNLFVDEGRLQESITYYRRALQVNPSYIKAHINLACTYRDLGDDDKAIEQYQEGIRLNPNHANARANLGFLLLKKGSVEIAIQEFNEAICLEPTHTNAHFGLGSCFMKQEQWSEAAKEFLTAHQLAPHDVETKFELGVALALSGQVSKGFAQAREAVKLDAKFLPRLRYMEELFPDQKRP